MVPSGITWTDGRLDWPMPVPGDRYGPAFTLDAPLGPRGEGTA